MPQPYQHLHAIWASLLLVLSSQMAYGQTAPAHVVPPASFSPEVYFVNLNEGDRVRSPFRIVFGLSRLGIAPAGVEKQSTGHHHLLVNTPLPPDLTKPIPFSDNYRHFGGGQSEAVIELRPGKHTLQLLFADSDHKPFVKTQTGESIVVFSKKLSIEVIR